MIDTVTGNLAFISRFHHFQINGTTFFHFRNTFFIQNYRFLYHGDQKISWWRICRWRAFNFEIHLCSSGMNCDCFWRSICIQYVQVEAGVSSGNGSCWIEIRDAKHVDHSRSTQVKIYTSLIASTDLWPQARDVYFFWKCLRWSSLIAVSVPTSVTGGLRGSSRGRSSFGLNVSHAYGRLMLQ